MRTYAYTFRENAVATRRLASYFRLSTLMGGSITLHGMHLQRRTAAAPIHRRRKGIRKREKESLLLLDGRREERKLPAHARRPRGGLSENPPVGGKNRAKSSPHQVAENIKTAGPFRPASSALW